MGSGTTAITALISQQAIDNAWDSSHSIGRYYSGAQGTGGALSRGAAWTQEQSAGLFSADLSNSAGSNKDTIGFRCTFSMP